MLKLIARVGLVSLALGTAGTVRAADLDYGYSQKDPEPYAPYYYHRDQPKQGYYEEKYEERRYSGPPPVVERGYDRPPRATYYEDVPPVARHPRHDQRACLSQGEIRYRLKEHGWQDFQEIDLRAETAAVTARRPDGLLYRLEVDRCSGVIVQARLLEEPRGWRQGARPGYSY